MLSFARSHDLFFTVCLHFGPRISLYSSYFPQFSLSNTMHAYIYSSCHTLISQYMYIHTPIVQKLNIYFL